MKVQFLKLGVVIFLLTLLNAPATVFYVNVNNPAPVSPYTSWPTAAINIQDAINVTTNGDTVLVTNGVYASGGKSMDGVITNRVSVDRAILLQSVNGPGATFIQGAYDPATTNGPGSVRCVWLTTNAIISGFTVCGGSTWYDNVQPGSGAGIWGAISNNVLTSMATNCLIITNFAQVYGGGAFQVILNNSTLARNASGWGGGAYLCNLKNCTVTANSGYYGGGTYSCNLTNCLVTKNFSPHFGGGVCVGTQVNCTITSNHGFGGGVFGGTLINCLVFSNVTDSSPSLNNYGNSTFSYSCTTPAASGIGNITANPMLLADGIHLATNSPCIGAGNESAVSGTDIDGQPWGNPPSMGCDEVVPANLNGPLTANVLVQTNFFVGRPITLTGYITGLASTETWNFGDGVTLSNSESIVTHQWTNSGDYTVAFSVFNNDNPAGVFASVLVHVLPLVIPQIQGPVVVTNGFQFSFGGQTNANYTVQYATNLIPPVSWQTLQTVNSNQQSSLQITDGSGINAARFYRVLVQ